MYHMRQFFVFAFLLFLYNFSVGQKKCALNSLSKESKTELMGFWKEFQESVKLRDTSKIISLCDFPFSVSAEILSAKRDIGEYFKLYSTNIMQYSILLFFEKQFESSLSLCNYPTECLILHGNLNKKHRTCVYEFFYIAQDKDGKNQERSFQITQVDSSYKLTSNWIRY